MQCAVNPRVGLEASVEAFPPSAYAKTVAVIGGGPAGITAALTAAGRGHNVTLFEREDCLGGALKFSKYVPFKYPLKNYLDFLDRQAEKSSLRVELGVNVSPEKIKGAYDAVIVAVGAEPLRPRIDGAERATCAVDIYGHEDRLGDNIFVVGGGQVGCETALHLSRLGKNVTLAEMRPDIAPDASKTHRDELLVELGKEDRLTIRTGVTCRAILPDCVICEKAGDAGETETWPADDVIIAAGLRPLTELAYGFVGVAEDVAVVGDCARPRTVEWAVKEGFYAALNL
jgi:pyruvate/2-oxoglutarate dehydrogenase complex dihydrolipoamide dehydrogenase (E3) component